MPDIFSHYILAQKTYQALPKQVQTAIENDALYLLGAVGGDLFYFYRLAPTAANLGRQFHALDACDLFTKLLEGDFSYAAGFATHYAVDSTLHPAVYSYCREKGSPLFHPVFERDLGMHISRKYGVTRRILPPERVLSCAYPLYFSARNLTQKISVLGIERCLKRFIQYQRYSYAHKGESYKTNVDFAKLNDTIEKSVALGAQLIQRFFAGEIPKQLLKNSFLQRD